MLRLEGITLRWGEFRLSADFTVAAGLRVAVLGPSGAGKSTLLDLIAGFLVPDAGRVLWQGRDITAEPPGARPVSILFQDNNLFPHLTAAQNVALALSPALRLNGDGWRRVEEALARVGLAGMERRRPAQLSGGERGRVALARAALSGRPLMLLDEPFAALGPAMKADMLALVAGIAADRGTTVLMVSHDPADAEALCGQTILVADGRATPPVPTARLLADPPPALAAYLGR